MSGALKDIPCSEEGCLTPARYGKLCDAHRKRQQRGDDMSAPVAMRPKSALERLREAAIAYADADEDDEFDRAEDNLRKSAKAYAGRGTGEEIRKALADARARGVRLGRPRKIDPGDVEIQIAQHGSVKRAAVALGVTTRTIRNARRAARGESGEAA